MDNILELDIYGFKCEVKADENKFITLLKKDFYYFLKKNQGKSQFFIEVFKDESYQLPSGMRANSQSQNSVSFNQGETKYNDYYGKAVTILEKNTLKLIYKDSSIVHEILYLVILSYSGKSLERHGRHKVHACGVSNSEKNILIMGSSKCGKTTLFMDLLMEPTMGIVSDDTPLIGLSGRVYPFPLRIGAEDRNEIIKRFPYLSESQLYEFDRVYFSKKYLLSLEDLKNKVVIGKKSILVSAMRMSGSKSKLVKVGRLKMFRELIRHMIVGIGLPLIVEHFFRIGWKDYFVNIQILISRTISAFMLVMKSDSYLLYLGSDRMRNRKLILDILDEN